MYDLVKEGAVIASRDFPDGPPALAANKGKWLPRLLSGDTYDPAIEVREGPVVQVQATRVKYTFTVRAKAGAELDALVADKDAAVEAEFNRRWTSPIAYPVGGQSYLWHADAGAITNISGVVLMIAVGAPVPNPRPWTPHGSLVPVDITHAELVGLGAAIASRKDALFVVKKQKQAAIAALTTAAEIVAYDPLAGWE